MNHPFYRYTTHIDAHGVIALKLSNGTRLSPPSFTFYNAAAIGNTLSGGASIRVISSSSISVVGFIGNGGTLTFNNIDGGSTTTTTKLVSVDYINADFVFGNTECSNCRNAFFSVNGGDPIQVQMPISGQVSIKNKKSRTGDSRFTELGWRHFLWIHSIASWIQSWENEHHRDIQSQRVYARLLPYWCCSVEKERKANSCGPGYDVLDDVNRYLTLTMNVINNRTRRRYLTKSKKRGEGRGSRKPLHAWEWPSNRLNGPKR